MDSVIFSQIPSSVLKKHRPASTRERKKKIKFWDDNHGKEVLSSRDEVVSDISSQNKESQNTVVEGAEPIEEVLEVSKIETSSVATQTDPPPLVTVDTQTEPSFKSPLKDSHEQYKNELEVNTLSSYQPLYSLPLACGKQPPLKIGMTLPKGKKRKVFYPDDENAD